MSVEHEWVDDWARDVEVANVKGPKGAARVLEGFRTDHDDSVVVVLIPQSDGSYRRATIVYSVDFAGQTEDFTSLGEAYFVAGQKVGQTVQSHHRPAEQPK